MSEEMQKLKNLGKPSCFECPLQRLVDILPKLEKMVEEKEEKHE